MSSFLLLLHLLGLALGVGAASVKLAMVVRSKRDPEFVQAFLESRKLITKFIVLGLVLLTASGIVWLLQGYSWSPTLIAKVVIVGLLWVIGPVIDNAVEPMFERLAPSGGEVPSQEFLKAQRVHLACEVTATALMYAAFVLGTQL